MTREKIGQSQRSNGKMGKNEGKNRREKIEETKKLQTLLGMYRETPFFKNIAAVDACPAAEAICINVLPSYHKKITISHLIII